MFVTKNIFLFFIYFLRETVWKNSGSKFIAIVLCVLLINSMRLNFFSWTKFFIWLLQIFFKTFQPFISGDIISVWCLKRIKNDFPWNGLKLFTVFRVLLPSNYHQLIANVDIISKSNFLNLPYYVFEMSNRKVLIRNVNY